MGTRVDGVMLAYMKAQAALTMTDTCTIEKQSDVRGAAGEIINNQWTTVATSVACRMITESARQNRTVVIGEQPTLPQRYTLVMTQGTTIEVNYRATLASDSSKWLIDNIVSNQTDEVTLQAVVIPETP